MRTRPTCRSGAEQGKAGLRPDKVVAVAEQDPLVERGGARPLGAVEGRGLGQDAGELVEEEPAQRALVARVAREQGALDRLGQVDECEDRAVEVRHVWGEPRALGL